MYLSQKIGFGLGKFRFGQSLTQSEAGDIKRSWFKYDDPELGQNVFTMSFERGPDVVLLNIVADRNREQTAAMFQEGDPRYL